MSTKENFKFVSFEAALIACQLLVAHYAIYGFQVTVSISRTSHSVDCSIFHDTMLAITPPTGFVYSSCIEREYRDTYWTAITFEF